MKNEEEVEREGRLVKGRAYIRGRCQFFTINQALSAVNGSHAAPLFQRRSENLH